MTQWSSKANLFISHLGNTCLVPAILYEDFHSFSQAMTTSFPILSNSLYIIIPYYLSTLNNLCSSNITKHPTNQLHKQNVSSCEMGHPAVSHLGSTSAELLLSTSPFSLSSSTSGVSQCIHCLLRCLAVSVFSSTFSIRLRRSVGGVLHLIL